MTAPLDVHGVFIGIDGFEIRNTLMKMLKEFPGGIAGRRLLSFFESIEHENWMLRAKLRWLMRGSGEEEEEERQTNILVTRVWERDEDLGNVKGTQTENEEEKRNVFDVSVETNSEEVEEILYAEKRRVEFPGRMIDSVTQTEDNKMDGNILEEKLEGKGKEKNKIELMKNDMEIEGIMVELGSAEKLEKINAEMTKELEKNRKKLEEECRLNAELRERLARCEVEVESAEVEESAVCIDGENNDFEEKTVADYGKIEKKCCCCEDELWRELENARAQLRSYEKEIERLNFALGRSDKMGINRGLKTRWRSGEGRDVWSRLYCNAKEREEKLKKSQEKSKKRYNEYWARAFYISDDGDDSDGSIWVDSRLKPSFLDRTRGRKLPRGALLPPTNSLGTSTRWHSSSSGMWDSIDSFVVTSRR